MNKIINILCHTLNNDNTLAYHVKGNWSARQAQNIIKYSSKYQCEVWYAVRNLKKSQAFQDDGITYKLFPAKTLSVRLESFYGIISCPLLFNALDNENPNTTGIHFQGERGSLLYILLKNYSYFNITLQYHGYGQPQYLEWVEKLAVIPKEIKYFPRIKHFFVHIKKRIENLQNSVHINKSAISFQNNGAEFERFKPADRNLSRTKLQIPKNAFVVLYVGAMTKSKGVDKIIAAVNILKQKYPNTYLLLVGATKSDPLHYKALESADRLVYLVDNKSLPDYYNASNVYCFYGDTKTREYAGVGTAPTEALACNINVISTNLIHLPDTIVRASGFVPSSFNDFIKKIEFLILHPKFVFKSRKIVYPYTSYQHTTKNILAVYDKLFSKKN